MSRKVQLTKFHVICYCEKQPHVFHVFFPVVFFFFFHRFSPLSAVCLRMTWGSGEKLLPCQLCCDCLLISKSARGQRLSCLQYMLLCLTPGSMLEKRAKERDTSRAIQILWMWKTNVKRCATLNLMSKGWFKAAIPNPRGSLNRLQKDGKIWTALTKPIKQNWWN